MSDYKSIVDGNKILSVMLTFTCPAECRDCGTLSSPRSRENISLGDVKQYISQATKAGFRLVAFTGGEATLRWNDLLAGIRFTRENGLMARLVTNAHWATREKVAQTKLQKLIDAGVSEINFSTGDEHVKFIPIERVLLATAESLKAGITTSVMIEAKKEREVTKSSFIGSLKDFGLTEKQLGLLSIVESPWMPLDPSTTEDYEEGMLANNRNVVSKPPCESLLRTITIQADARISPCCGLGMREISELNVAKIGDTISEVMRRSESDIMKLAIHYIGPYELLRMASVSDSTIEWENKYAHICQACARIYHDKKVQRALKAKLDQIKEKIADKRRLDKVITSQLIISSGQEG